MILECISNINAFNAGNQLIKEALEWVALHKDDRHNQGSIMIADGTIKVNCERVSLSAKEDKLLEAHRRFIDIHVPLDSTETMGWAPISLLTDVATPYDETADIAFYSDSPQNYFDVKPGQFAIFFPEDAHAPNIGNGEHLKLCIKIPTND